MTLTIKKSAGSGNLFRTPADAARAIKDLVQRDWHFASVGMGNCRAAQANLRELHEQLLIQSAVLANANFNSDEPRDRDGQWTTNAGGTTTNSSTPAQQLESGEASQSTLTAARVHTTDDALRVCLKILKGAVFAEKAVWRGATKENIPGGSSTEEQRSQTAFFAKTLRAVGLLSVACVGSAVTARCGDAPASPPWPRPKSLAAAPFRIFRQALKFFAEHATKNPVLRQLLLRTMRVLTSLGSAGGKELSGLSKAVVADVAAEMMHTPEFGGNIRAFILGKEMPVDKALRDSALEQQFRGEAPIATVAGNLSVKLAEVLPMILGMRALPVGVQKILDTIFTLKMLKDAPGIARQLIEEFRKPSGQRDYNKIDSLVADAIETLGFTTLGIFGSKESSKGEPAKIREEAVETKEVTAKTESESPNAETSEKVTADEIPNQNKYRATFFAAHPELRGKVIVHHAIEQKVLKWYPGVMTVSEIHNLANLRGIPKEGVTKFGANACTCWTNRRKMRSSSLIGPS